MGRKTGAPFREPTLHIREWITGLWVLCACARASAPSHDPSGVQDLFVLFDNRPENHLRTSQEPDCAWRRRPIATALAFLRSVIDSRPESGNTQVELLWPEEDGTLVVYRNNKDQKQPWKGSFSDYARSLQRCDSPDWIRRQGRSSSHPLVDALALLDEWWGSRPTPEKEPSDRQDSLCRQVFLFLMTGTWTNDFLRDEDVHAFLDRLKEISDGHLCALVLVLTDAARKSLPSALQMAQRSGLVTIVALSDVQSRDLSSVVDKARPRSPVPSQSNSGLDLCGLRDSTPDCLEPPASFRYSCGEALEDAACNARLCESFWSLTQAGSPYRYRRLILLGDAPHSGGTSGRTLKTLDCGVPDSLAVQDLGGPDHPLHHFVLLDMSGSMVKARYWRGVRNLDGMTYAHLMRAIANYARPYDRISVYILGERLYHAGTRRVGVDPGAHAFDITADSLAAINREQSSPIRSLLTVLGEGVTEFEAPEFVVASETGQGDRGAAGSGMDSDVARFRESVRHTVVWVYSDGEENQISECEKVPESEECQRAVGELLLGLPGSGRMNGQPPAVLVLDPMARLESKERPKFILKRIEKIEEAKEAGSDSVRLLFSAFQADGRLPFALYRLSVVEQGPSGADRAARTRPRQRRGEP